MIIAGKGSKTVHLGEPMYRKKDRKTQRMFTEYCPFSGALDPGNRWIRLERLIPWEALEEEYMRRFADRGRPAKDARLVVGLILLKHIQCMSDREVVAELRENPYQQWFCGLEQFETGSAIEASTLSVARERMGPKYFERLEKLCLEVLKQQGVILGKGLLVDATVVEEGIKYPNDVGLLERVRQGLVKGLKGVGATLGKRYRTYARKAKTVAVGFSKMKRKSKKAIHKAKKQMLQFVRRNLRQLEEGVKEIRRRGLMLPPWILPFWKVALAIYAQQEEMYRRKERRVDKRIVSLHKPYVRPMVRGKGGKEVEFGPKVSLALVDGMAFVDKISYENYGEGEHLREHVEGYVERFGMKPPWVVGDRSFGTRDNRKWVKEEEIRDAFHLLGRKARSERTRDRWVKQKQRERNQIEGAFGTAKTRYGLRRILYHGPQGGEIWIRMGFLSMNLMQALKRI